jgi:molybdate transport system ATP-binding protein
MYTNRHCAIYILKPDEKKTLIQQLTENIYPPALQFLNNLKGLFFTNHVLQNFIKEELRHDKYYIKPVNGISLATSSDGEQKKALLYYLLQQVPGYLVINDIFDSLDSNARTEIMTELSKAAVHTVIVQLVERTEDILPFVETTLLAKDKQLVDVNEAEIAQLSINSKTNNYSIPIALETIAIMQTPLIQFTDVTVYYDERCILRNINWQINRGEYWQLKGPNGSGKTTLLSMINGDNTKAYGQNIFLFGYKKGTGESVWDIKKNIGYFSQAIMRFFERPDSAENMIVGGLFDSVGLYQLPSDAMKILANNWLKVLGLKNEAAKPFSNFSPGHQRMILIARAMIKHPPLLILDEPTTGLNNNDAALVVSLINQIAAQTNTAIIFVSHRQEPGLKPTFVFELEPSKNGSNGRVIYSQ